MRKVVGALFIVVAFLTSVIPASPIKGWSWGHHGAMTRDALEGIAEEVGLTWDEINLISSFADDVDLVLGDPKYSCHRVAKYRDEFNELNKARKKNQGKEKGDNECDKDGAEEWARIFISQAKESYKNGNRDGALKWLGYAIHYIQDAVNPPHVFPFKVETLSGPHFNFERYALEGYMVTRREWASRVKKASAKKKIILDAADLKNKIIKAAEEVSKFSVCYPCIHSSVKTYCATGRYNLPFLLISQTQSTGT